MGFAVTSGPNRRTIRSPVNPMDKSTIVSIYPQEIDETKHTIQPGRFVIPPGSYEKPAILIVGPSSWWRDIDDSQPLLEIPVSSINIADDIVKGYCSGLLECDMADNMPGLFYLPGCITNKENQPDNDLTRTWIETTHKALLDKALQKQKNWYRALVKLADGLWVYSGGSPQSISDNMRMAAKELNLNNKEWLKDYVASELIKCVACGSLRNPDYPICPNCKSVVDVEKATALNLKFAS